MAKLTAKKLEAFTANDHGTILREDGGLVAKVRAGVRGVTILFRFEFKHEGVKRDLSLGSWPKKSLAQIRAERDEVKAVTTKGILPIAARKAANIEAQAAVAATIAQAERRIAENKTVSDLFEEWIRDGVSREDANAELRRSFTKDVLPIIGKKPLRSLTEKDLLTVLRSVKARGLNRTVVIRSKDIGQMLRPANKRVQCAVWICLGTLCRIGELLKAEWKHLDFEKGNWFIPAKTTKGRQGKRQDHHVFLSAFALEQFKMLNAHTGHTRFCFPSRDENSHVDTKTISKLIGDRQCSLKNRSKPLPGRHHDDSLVLSKGTKGEWTPHDLRRTGATLMQVLGVNLDIIDRCQNHQFGGSKVRRHYLHYNYAKEKSEAWRILGEHLIDILSSSNK
ncbi:tyrosine-type recombinase/integrase [Pseudomonas sp. KCJK8670]|uniref:tyrosine-type recombinase/integrase n=1 Tax=Pseudomonas sp. KCJK8670 TaxID=3344558 RepID=UPI00390698DB